MSRGIYILGGMGPQASAVLYRLIIDKAQARYGAVNNEDYPEVAIHSIPVPDFISDESREDEALQMLIDRVLAIPTDIYDEFAIACNTAHLLVPDLVSRTSLSFVSMIDGVAERVAGHRAKKIGLLASPVTIKTGLYQKALEKHGAVLVTPGADTYAVIDDAIRAVIANEPLEAHRAKLKQIVGTMRGNGAELIVLGCTELPLVFGDAAGDDMISSLDVLSDDLLESYYRQPDN